MEVLTPGADPSRHQDTHNTGRERREKRGWIDRPGRVAGGPLMLRPGKPKRPNKVSLRTEGSVGTPAWPSGPIYYKRRGKATDTAAVGV